MSAATAQDCPPLGQPADVGQKGKREANQPSPALAAGRAPPIRCGGPQPVVDAFQPQVAQVQALPITRVSRSRLASSPVTVSHIALPRLSK